MYYKFINLTIKIQYSTNDLNNCNYTTKPNRKSRVHNWALLLYCHKENHTPLSGGPQTAADGDCQRKRERGAERNAERSGGTVAWLDTPAAEPPRLEVKYYPLAYFCRQ